MHTFHKKTFLFTALLAVGYPMLQAQDMTKVSVTNQSSVDLIDYTVEIPAEQLPLPLDQYIAVDADGRIVPVELTKDIDGNTSLIFPTPVVKKNATQTYTLQKGTAPHYPKRTYAEISHKIGGEFVQHGPDKKNKMEYTGGFSWVKPNYLRVPDGFTDHAYYIKYEGPGWESDKVAFRFYLDWRNGIDVFAKKTPEISLPAVGTDGYDNYHEPSFWGMDNMKVGDALGIGSIAIWDGAKAIRVEKTDSVLSYVPADGKIRSQVKTHYYGWDANGVKCNLTSLISIDAGSRATRMQLEVDKPLENLATGIIRNKDVAYFTSANAVGKWGYIASFGKQSLNDDMMGLALFYRKDQLKEIREDDKNYVVVLTPQNGQVEYYFMPTWELDWEPVKTRADFQRCIDEVFNRLNADVNIRLLNPPSN